MREHPRREPISPWLNPVTRALREGKVCVGAYSVHFPGLAVAQVFAQAGFSFVVFDMEHTDLTIDALGPTCIASKLAGIVPIAGTSGTADFQISRPLDTGAMGVVVPHVNNSRQV